jgi:hypothetical protein
VTRERFISGGDTVALFSEEIGPGYRASVWVHLWTGRLLDWLVDNGVSDRDDVLAVVRDLAGADCTHRTGGGAAPVFELRLIARAL